MTGIGTVLDYDAVADASTRLTLAIIQLGQNAASGLQIHSFSQRRYINESLLEPSRRVDDEALTYQSVIKTTILLYIATPSGITAACDAMGAVLIIGRWKPFV